ncbi:ricin-type beta-trefoil lectin domain protein [Streptomyces sp. NPDC001640]
MDVHVGVQENSPGPVPSYGPTDEQLAAELKKSAGKRPVHHPVGELLDRHWESAYVYARLCTDGAHPAGMLTTAAFTRLFEDSAGQGGPTAAWRPQLLVTVRRLAGQWDTDHRRSLLHPDLRSRPDSAERAALRLLPSENRRLVSRAFQRLPEPARCLLWHVEVECEEPAVPAALLGIDPLDAVMRLERARELLREVCLDIHRESAPDEGCRRYARLLDVSLRRNGTPLDPDLRLHMDGCAHCHNAAEQLDGFHKRLALLLAEGVLGWGAQAYLDAKSAQARAATASAPGPVGGEPLIDQVHATSVPEPPAPAVVAPDAPGGGLRRFSGAAAAVVRARSAAAHKASRPSPHRRQIALAVAAVSALVLIPLAVWSGSRADGQAATGAGAPSGDPGHAPEGASASPSWVGAAADVPTGAFTGRLRHQDSGLCIGLDQQGAVVGAEAVLVSCTSPEAQQWSYEADGLLRSATDPGLCLDSHLGYAVQLAACADESQAEAKNVRYDITLQGVIVPRWNQGLALAPAAPAADVELVAKARTQDGTQRWAVDTPSAQQMQSLDPAASAAVSGDPFAAPSDMTRIGTEPTTPPGSAAGVDPSSDPGRDTCPAGDCAPGDQGDRGDQGDQGDRGDHGEWGDGDHDGRGSHRGWGRHH